jgi:hypothetical protein
VKTAFLSVLAFSATLLVSQNAKTQDAKTRAAKLQDETIEEVGKTPVQAKFAAGGRVRMDLCSGGIQLVGRDDNAVRVSYQPDHDVKVRIRVLGDEADLKVTGCPSNNFKMTIEVPKSSGLDIRMFAGDLEISGIVGDKDVRMHFGELRMDIGNAADCALVSASVSSGSLVVSPFNVSKGGLFRSFEQSGPGKYRVHAHIGAGDLQLR